MKKSFQKYKNVVLELSGHKNEPEWFLNYRLQALEALDSVQAKQIERLDYSGWGLFGEPEVEKASMTSDTRNNDFVFSYEEALAECPDRFKGILEQSDLIEFAHLFNAYTFAFLTSGVLIYVPDNTDVAEPIILEHQLDNAVQSTTSHQLLVYVGENSSVKIIDKYTNTENPNVGTVNVQVDVIGKAGANIQYSAVDQFNDKTTAYIQRTGQTSKDTQLNWAIGAMSSGNVIEDIQVSLAGTGSSSDVKTVAISHQEQTQAINTHVVNNAVHTAGHIYQHGVALEESSLLFNGIGQIMKHSKNSEAHQESRVLMLSDDARADANPILLIEENEVQAGHAASISRVDQEQLYYFMSRGLSQNQAEKLIIRGFLGIVLSDIPNEKSRNEFIETIERILVRYGN